MPKQDPFSILREDHATLKTLLGELTGTSTEGVVRRTALVRTIKKLFEVHTALEAEIFYMAFQESSPAKQDQKKYYEALEEHDAVRLAFAELEQADPATPRFAGKAKVLKGLILRHSREEEREMFPRAREHLFEEEVVGLTIRMTARRNELETISDVLEMMTPSETSAPPATRAPRRIARAS